MFKKDKITGKARIDFCSIDAEGMELDILHSINFSKVSIGAFSIENTYKTPHLCNFLRQKG